MDRPLNIEVQRKENICELIISTFCSNDRGRKSIKKGFGIAVVETQNNVIIKIRSFPFLHLPIISLCPSVIPVTLLNVYRSAEHLFLLKINFEFLHRIWTELTTQTRYKLSVLNNKDTWSIIKICKNNDDNRAKLRFIKQCSQYTTILQSNWFAIKSYHEWVYTP